MQLYPGVDPITTGVASGPGVVLFPFPTGFGSYTVAADCITGADLRNAQNFSAGIQGNRDAIAWMTWRLPDWVSGGDYTSYTAEMTFGNELIWLGQHDFFGLTNFHNVVTVISTTSLQVQGLLEVSGSQQLNATATYTQIGPTIRSGAKASVANREGNLPFAADSSNHFDPSTLDFVLYDSGTNTTTRTWTFDPPASGTGQVVQFMPGPSATANAAFNLTLALGGGATWVIGSGTTLVPFRIYYSATMSRWRMITSEL